MAGSEQQADAMSASKFRLGSYSFDLRLKVLSDEKGDLVPLRSQSLDVLAILLENNSDIVSKDALFEKVWPDTIVAEGSLSQCISDIRRAIDDTDHKIVQTLPKKGYRVLAETAEAGQGAENLVTGPSVPRRANGQAKRWIVSVLGIAAVVSILVLWFWPRTEDAIPPLPTGPRIAIVPLSSTGDADENRQLAAGLTEDIATTLSRFTNLFVLSVHATRAYADQQVDPRQIGTDLSVQYVLEGSVRRSETSIRITVKLLDATTAERIWSETYDRDLTAENILSVLDEIVASIVATLASNTGIIAVRESEKVPSGRAETLSAYECTARVAWFRETLSPERRLDLRTCLERAVLGDPNYAQAWAELANILIETYKNETFTEEQADALLLRADTAAKRATQIDRGNEMGFYLQAIVAQLRGEDYETFKELADKALDANPNNANVVGDIGNFSYYSGDHARGLALVGRMMELNPRYPSWAHYVFFLDHYRKGEYKDALTEALKINLTDHCMIQWSTAAAYGKVGEAEKGKRVLRHVETIEPTCPDDPRDPFRKRGFDDDLVDSIYDGLLEAGFEEI